MSLYEWLEISNEELQNRVKTGKGCIVEGCSEPFFNGFCLCEEHLKEYRRWKKVNE